MKHLLLLAIAFLSIAAVAQTGTNSGDSQQIQKPRTGRNDEVITSPDINTYITGTAGTTTGRPADVSTATEAVAGSSSAASLTTAEVSTREQLERQRLTQLLGKTQGNAAPQPPSPPFVNTAKLGKAQNGRNAAEESRLNGQQPGPSTDNGPVWAQQQKPPQQ